MDYQKIDNFLQKYYIEINEYLFKAFNDYIKSKNLTNLSNAIFGYQSRMTNKILLQRVIISDEEETFIDFPLAWKIHVFAKKMSFNKDLIFNTVQNYSIEYKEDMYSYESLNIQTIKRLKMVYTEQRILQLFFTTDYMLLEDVNKMLLKIIQTCGDNWKNFLPNKPKDLKTLHDALNIASCRLGNGDFDLNQREDVLKIDNQIICEKYKIIVPKTHFDLVELGRRLHFCIGNGVYSKEVLQRKTSIVAIHDVKTDKPLYGIEFNRYTLKQAKGFDNSSVPDKIICALENLIISRPELPEDFINMTNHKFIKGYKYNNKDLFVLFNTNHVYVYEGISRELYEAFEKAERKGEFFHKFIRKMPYLKIK